MVNRRSESGIRDGDMVDPVLYWDQDEVKVKHEISLSDLSSSRSRLRGLSLVLLISRVEPSDVVYSLTSQTHCYQ